MHMRGSSPPIKYPCFYGVDFPTYEELVANKRTLDEIRDYLEVDTLGSYLPVTIRTKEIPIRDDRAEQLLMEQINK